MELRERSPLRAPTPSYVLEGKIATSENLEAGLAVAHADRHCDRIFFSVDICGALSPEC